MRASEAKELSPEELVALKSLLGRWVLRNYPWNSGSSGEGDAFRVYEDVARDAEAGRMVSAPGEEEVRERGRRESRIP